MNPSRSTPVVVVVPGVGDSGPAHWQTLLHEGTPGAVRVVQGADPDTGATLGVTMLSVEPGMTQGVRGVPSARKSAMLRKR